MSLTCLLNHIHTNFLILIIEELNLEDDLKEREVKSKKWKKYKKGMLLNHAIC